MQSGVFTIYDYALFSTLESSDIYTGSQETHMEPKEWDSLTSTST